MKHLPEVLVAIAAAILIILGEPNRALAVSIPIPQPTISVDNFVNIPVIKSEDGKYWESQLQCDNSVQSCIVINSKQICIPGKTNFSPAFCSQLEVRQ